MQTSGDGGKTGCGGVHLQSQHSGSWDRGSQLYWSTNFTYLMSSRLIRNPVLKTKVGDS